MKNCLPDQMKSLSGTHGIYSNIYSFFRTLLTWKHLRKKLLFLIFYFITLLGHPIRKKQVLWHVSCASLWIHNHLLLDNFNDSPLTNETVPSWNWICSDFWLLLKHIPYFASIWLFYHLTVLYTSQFQSNTVITFCLRGHI